MLFALWNRQNTTFYAIFLQFVVFLQHFELYIISFFVDLVNLGESFYLNKITSKLYII